MNVLVEHAALSQVHEELSLELDPLFPRHRIEVDRIWFRFSPGIEAQQKLLAIAVGMLLEAQHDGSNAERDHAEV